VSNAGKGERKTRLKTIRLPESYALSLKKEAAEKGTTVNALINSIIGLYINWQREADEFGFISVHKKYYETLIEEADEETLVRLGREVVLNTWKEMAEFRFQDSTPDKMLELLTMKWRLDKPPELTVTRDEDAYTIVFRNDNGPKYGIVAESAFREFVRQSFHVEPRISRGESIVTVRFKANPRS
jgi:hypothetical protein